METLYQHPGGAAVRLHPKPLAAGGEGTVHQTDRHAFLAKIYHRMPPGQTEKLECMIAHPPADPMRACGHLSFAWPTALLRDRRQQVVGFEMPAIANSLMLFNVCIPKTRNQKALGFDLRYLHATAMNLSSVVHALHQKGYIIGDINPQNILVNAQALISFIDVDSFQVTDSRRAKIHRSPVASEGFIPPELIQPKMDFRGVTRTATHDRFGLAVLIYQLLLGGHPFRGKWRSAGAAPEVNASVKAGHWLYGPSRQITPGPFAVPLEVLHPGLQDLFRRCFTNGHRQPQLRPTPAEWRDALKAAIGELVDCANQSNHVHHAGYGRCPWCEREQAMGIKDFPGLGKTRRINAHAPARVQTPPVAPAPSLPGRQSKNYSAPCPTPQIDWGELAAMIGRTVWRMVRLTFRAIERFLVWQYRLRERRRMTTMQGSIKKF